MTDYKSMYYHLAGRTATAVDVLEMSIKTLNSTLDAMKSTMDAMKTTMQAVESTAESLAELCEKLKFAQQTTEEMFISVKDEDFEKCNKKC